MLAALSHVLRSPSATSWENSFLRYGFARRGLCTATERNVIVGIDFGTTNSCVAVMEGTEPRVIENAEGARTTPSVVAFTDDGQRLVGMAAKRQAMTNPSNTFHSIKRILGRRYNDPSVQKNMPLVPYKIVRGPNGDAWVEIRGQPSSPAEISAFVLMKMKETAEGHVGRAVPEAVLTVPAYFNDRQRQAMKQAGKIAGLEVRRILNEPTAAALAYAAQTVSKDGAAKTVAVYDLGGGTFDVSVLKIANGVFEVKATNGDTFLGGEDFDARLLNYITSEYKKQTKIELTQDKLAMQRLRDAAETAKCELSSTMVTEINLPYITADATGPKHLNMKINRATFEKLVDDLITKTVEPCNACFRDAGIKPSDINEVVMVGGMTRMPKVQDTVQKIFGKPPLKGINPDESVAIGAAIQAAVLKGEVKEVTLFDIAPLSLGIETRGGVFTRVIPKNSPIPTSQSRVFSTALDGQTEVEVKVLQGEREVAADNTLLGRFSLVGIPPAPKGVPRIEVHFDINENGIVQVSARDKATNIEQSIVVESTGGLTGEQLEKIMQDVANNAELDKKWKQLVSAKNNADSAIYDALRAIREYNRVSQAEIDQVKAAITELRAAVSVSDEDKIRELVSHLNKTTHKVFGISVSQQS